MAALAGKQPPQGSIHRYNTRRGGIPPKRHCSGEIPEGVQARGKRRRAEEDIRWRRRDSVTHLLASIYADIETAIDLQRRRVTGTAGTSPLTEDEQSSFENSEDLRLDHLRELRLADMFSKSKERSAIKKAKLPRGRRYDSIRAARDVVFSAKTAYARRLKDLVRQLGWTVMAICLHSPNFRTRFLEAIDAADFADRLELLRSHKASIDFFARSRLFDWLEDSAEQRSQDVLFRDLRCLLASEPVPENAELSEEEIEDARLRAETELMGFPEDDAQVQHPDEWKLSADDGTVMRLEFLPGQEAASMQLQRNIENSEILFEGQRWMGRKKWLVRNEPRYRTRHDGECKACEDEGDGEGKKWRAGCQCPLESLRTRFAADGAYFGDRIQLQHINPTIGTGVRALQRLPAGSLLAEYVGEIYPINKTNQHGIYNNHTYLYTQRRTVAAGKAEDVMYIDPSVRGNWTRYLNHSCRPKTDFTLYTCGDKVLTCVTVRDRPIEFGEEITVSYGKDYFVHQQLACRCGEDVCTLWNADLVEKNRVTLLEAKEQGIAPDWAV